MLINTILCVALTIGGFRTVSVEGNGVVRQERRKVSSFSAIDISGLYDVEIVSQQPSNLEIRGDENILPLIITEVKNNTLFVYHRKNISPKHRLKIKISSLAVEEISTKGTNNLNIHNINNRTLSLTQNGVGTTAILGQAKEVYLNISGTIKVKAQKMYSQKAHVKLSGASTIDIYVSEQLTANILGLGKINYYGNPQKIIRNIVGIGSINSK